MFSFMYLEVAMYVGLIVFLILISQYADLSQDTLFGFLALLMFFASVVRITKRIERESWQSIAIRSVYIWVHLWRLLLVSFRL